MFVFRSSGKINYMYVGTPQDPSVSRNAMKTFWEAIPQYFYSVLQDIK